MMYKLEKKRKKLIRYVLPEILMMILLLSGCAGISASSDKVQTQNETQDAQRSIRKRKAELEKLTRGNLTLEEEKLADYGQDALLIYDETQKQMVYSLTLPDIPQSDDAYVYLFGIACYKDEDRLYGKPVAFCDKGNECQINFTYEEEDLFQLFVPALLVNGKYVPLSGGVYLSNPEAVAENQEAYPEVASKKGLLLDPTMLRTKKLTDLGVEHAIYNIPLSIIMGETTDETFPTIVYTYKGTDYYFNGAAINGYDGLFTYLNELGMCTTAIVLNDWNDAYPEMVHPDARNKNNKAYYYMFNTAQQGGTTRLEAVASFLAKRYSGSKYGLVHNWVIANEINQQKIWNYMDTDDVDYYAQEYEKAFRIFYQAVKSQYANAKVYFSIDHDWNSNEGKSTEYFNGKDLVAAFNLAAEKHGNYDWGIAIHPYPEPITKVNYWSQDYDKTKDAPILSIMNLRTLTDFLKQEEFLDTEGEVRDITITELGFTSASGEKLQAAACAYCYYIVEANPYIDAFIMNRQTDAPEEMKSGLAFGVYRYDQSEKYLKEVFQYMDTDKAEEYQEFMLNILGAETLEEALSWAE